MININNLTIANKVLRKELSNNIKNSNEIKEHYKDKVEMDPFSRLCDIIGRLDVLMKVVREDNK